MLPWLAKAFAKRAYHEIERVEGPLIVHTFSNGGFFMLSTVLQHAHLHASEKEEEDRFRPRVEKIIFDSCPSLPMRAETLAGCASMSPHHCLPMFLLQVLQHTVLFSMSSLQDHDFTWHARKLSCTCLGLPTFPDLDCWEYLV